MNISSKLGLQRQDSVSNFPPTPPTVQVPTTRINSSPRGQYGDIPRGRLLQLSSSVLSIYTLHNIKKYINPQPVCVHDLRASSAVAWPAPSQYVHYNPTLDHCQLPKTLILFPTSLFTLIDPYTLPESHLQGVSISQSFSPARFTSLAPNISSGLQSNPRSPILPQRFTALQHSSSITYGYQSRP